LSKIHGRDPPTRKWTGKKTKIQPSHTLERLQHPEIELQQNNVVGRIWLAAVLQICQNDAAAQCTIGSMPSRRPPQKESIRRCRAEQDRRAKSAVPADAALGPASYGRWRLK
jgi:hypothetical protein